MNNETLIDNFGVAVKQQYNIPSWGILCILFQHKTW